MKQRIFIVLAAILGAFAISLGAFGAHGLKNFLASADDGVRRMEWWKTAAHYHLVHSVLLFILVNLKINKWIFTSYVFAVLGICLFSGSLYVMTITNLRPLGMVTPIGGVCFIISWFCLIGTETNNK